MPLAPHHQLPLPPPPTKIKRKKKLFSAERRLWPGYATGQLERSTYSVCPLQQEHINWEVLQGAWTGEKECIWAKNPWRWTCLFYTSCLLSQWCMGLVRRLSPSISDLPLSSLINGTNPTASQWTGWDAPYHSACFDPRIRGAHSSIGRFAKVVSSVDRVPAETNFLSF